MSCEQILLIYLSGAVVSYLLLNAFCFYEGDVYSVIAKKKAVLISLSALSWGMVVIVLIAFTLHDLAVNKGDEPAKW